VSADDTPVEIKDDPSTAAPPFVRPEQFGVELNKEYVVVANIAIIKNDGFTTAVFNVFFDYSTNNAGTWTTLSHARYTAPGGATAGRGENVQFQIETGPVAGSALTGAVEGGRLMVRARWGQVGGTTETMRFSGTSVIGEVGGFNLKLIKQLPAGT
jgi:hypothetical protein